MHKLATVTLAVLLVGLFAAVVYAAVDAGDDSSSTVRTTETSPTTETTETTTTTDDDGTPDQGRVDDDPAGVTTTPDDGVDISGPCDEAEHANDPRCTGITPRVEDDRGVDVDRGLHGDHFDDHGGERDDNSGPGSVEDSSGPGGGDSSGQGATTTSRSSRHTSRASRGLADLPLPSARNPPVAERESSGGPGCTR